MHTQGPARDRTGLFSHPPLHKWQLFLHLSQSVSTPRFACLYSSRNFTDDSLRVAVAGQLLYPPFTHLGWDQNADALSDVSANDVAQFEHIAGFGRPLFVFLFSCSFRFIDQS
jgi:hypothetical protein